MSAKASNMRWIVSQIGAREHYAVPLGLHRLGLLDRLYTDAWCYRGSSLLKLGPAPLQRFAGRKCREIPNAKVTAFNAWSWVQLLRRQTDNATQNYEKFLTIGEAFAGKVTRALRQRGAKDEEYIFFGFDTGCLETLEWLNTCKVFSVVDQIDPAADEYEIVTKECKRWPEWEKRSGAVPQSYYNRLKGEWHAASAVLVNSEWSRQALIRQGVPADKLIVVPCAYEAPVRDAEPQRREGPLRVLWVGSVILRKGIQYLMEAARLLDARRFQIRVVGPIGISDAAVATAPGNLRFDGPVPRTRLTQVYREADVFVFPTLSDGFGITQLEAMSHGLPVIATPNCGAVVTHESDGMIVPARDARALAEALARFESDRDLLLACSRNALEKVEQFSIEKVTQKMLGIVGTMRSHVART